MIIGINVINIFIRRQSNCEDSSDLSTDECASVPKAMPHEMIEMNIDDIAKAPEGFQPDENQTYSISEEYSPSSTAPDDEGIIQFLLTTWL